MSAVVSELLTAPLRGFGSPEAPSLPLWTAMLAGLLIMVMIYWNRAIGSHPIPRKMARYPGGLPFFGDMFYMLRNYRRLFQDVLEYFRQHNYGTFCFSIPAQPMLIMTCDCRNVEHVSKTKFENYQKAGLFKERMEDALGDGIFNTDGHSWWLQRKSVSRIFSEGAFNKYMEHVFTETMVLLLDRLERASKSGSPVDLYALMHRYTFDSFCKLGFGYDANSMNVEGSVPFMDAFDRSGRRMSARFLWPFWQLMERCSPLGRQMAMDVALVRGTFTNHVREKLAKAQSRSALPDTSTFQCKDIVSLVIELAQNEPNSEELLSEQFLVDVVVNLIFAGRDTTALALSWGFHELMLHPEVVEKLREELRVVLGDTPGVKISYQEVKKLKYANAVFLESTRLHPPVSFIPKMAVKADILPDGTQVPAGATVAVAVHGTCRNPEFWGPDSEEFKPERWLDMQALPPAHKFPVFHGGPRVCLGRNMAQIEGTYVLAQLVSRYDFKLVEGHVVTPDMSLTLPMRYGMMVHVQPRA